MPRIKHAAKVATPAKESEGGSSEPSAPQKTEVTPIDRNNPVLFQRKKKVYSVGIAKNPNIDLRHFVKWPLYIRVQRQRRILMARMKVPPAIHQFSRTLDKGVATTLFRILHHHRPETRLQKKARLLQAAATPDVVVQTPKPIVVKYGIRHVTNLIEQRKAKLVIIANDVSPIELVVWLPTLCKKKSIPYVIVKSKSRLGAIVHKKTVTVLAFVDVKQADKADFANLVQVAQERYNDVYSTTMRTHGGLLPSNKKVMQMRKSGKQSVDTKMDTVPSTATPVQ